jgi:hypothetical protein
MCRRFSEKVLFVGHDLFQQRMILHRCYTTLVFRNDNNLNRSGEKLVRNVPCQLLRDGIHDVGSWPFPKRSVQPQ